MAAKKNTTTVPAAAVAADATNTATGPDATGATGGAAAAVWDAVVANPGATVPVIANAAGVTRAVAKAELAALAEAGRVVCAPGGRGDNGRALPDTWAPAPDAPADDAPATEPTADADAPVTPAVTAEAIQEAMRIMQAEADRRAQAEAELAQAMAEEEARRAKVLAELAKARTVEETRRALADLLAAVTTTYAAVVSGDEAAMTAGLERIYTATNTVRKASKVGAVRTGGKNSGGGGGADRAAPRPLRPEVIAHLNAHPGKEFTPAEIAKVLGRSSGAVANALETAAKNGEAVLTSERPMRYTATTPATGGQGGAS